MGQVYVPADLRRLVRERAGERCEYCLLPEAFSYFPHEVDHVVAIKHGGETTAANLALACTTCNKRKGTDLTSIDPDTGESVPLFNPRRATWTDHFTCDQAMLIPLTAVARATVRLLQLNLPERIAERQLLLDAGAIVFRGKES